MDRDIAVALEYWREINNDPRKWASLDMIQFTHERIVRMDWGYRMVDGGFKQVAIASRYFHPDGTWHDAVHP